jgi:hypothetical protein
MTKTLAAAILVLIPSMGFSQAPGKEVAKKPKLLLTKEQVPGYEPQLVEGFTLILSKEALKHIDNREYTRTPVQVLEQELKTIVSSFPAKAVNVLRRLPIWVEWNMGENGEEGRPGVAIAVYYPGDPAQMMRRKRNPLMAKTVRILRLKSLTEEHQPDDDSGRCVILHEIAHAVHDQLLGSENEAVLAAYDQARERKLINNTMYAWTNDHEFFAEMTCAYFDQLDYFPRTRSELLKHDPVTHKLMEGVWGKGKLIVPGRAALSVVKAPALNELPWGEGLIGPVVNAETASGKPTVILYWNAADPGSITSLVRIAQLDTALREFGVVTTAVHLATADKEDAKKLAKERDIEMSIANDRWLVNGIVPKFKDMPTAMVYDHQGRCVFKGSPTEAEMTARLALGWWILSKWDIPDPPKTLVPIVKDLKDGKSPSSLFAKLATAARSKDDETAAAAMLLIETICAPGQVKFDAASADAKSEPVAAFFKFEHLAATFKDSPLGTKAAAETARLKGNKLVSREIAARSGLAEIKKLEAFLLSRPGSTDLTSNAFRLENAATIQRLETATQKLWQAYPDTRASQQANRIAAKFSGQ